MERNNLADYDLLFHYDPHTNTVRQVTEERAKGPKSMICKGAS